MATYYNHAQIGIVDANGDVNVIYPKTTGTDVSVTPNSNYSAGDTVQKVINNLGSAAFSSLSNSYNDSPSTSDGYTQSVINTKLIEFYNTINDKMAIIDNGTYKKYTDQTYGSFIFYNVSGCNYVYGKLTNSLPDNRSTTLSFTIDDSFKAGDDFLNKQSISNDFFDPFLSCSVRVAIRNDKIQIYKYAIKPNASPNNINIYFTYPGFYPNGGFADR